MDLVLEVEVEVTLAIKEVEFIRAGRVREGSADCGHMAWVMVFAKYVQVGGWSPLMRAG